MSYLVTVVRFNNLDVSLPTLSQWKKRDAVAVAVAVAYPWDEDFVK